MTRNAAGIVAKITGSVHCVRDESVTLCIFNTRQSTYLDQIDSSRKAAANASDRPHDERFPTLCGSNLTQNRVMGSCRASSYPLSLPPEAVRLHRLTIVGCRVFAGASSIYLRTSKLLGSLHIAAYSRSAGRPTSRGPRRPRYPHDQPPLRRLGGSLRPPPRSVRRGTTRTPLD